jgi:large subunit ribosomal protein L21
MSYAIISVGGKQYRVSEGEKLLVDRLPNDAGKTFTPQTLLVGGDGDADLSPKGVTVTARVVEHVLGEKVRIGKYKPKSGYRRHAGYRSRLSRIEIESIGKKSERATKAKAETPATEKAKPAARRSATTKKKEGQ